MGRGDKTNMKVKLLCGLLMLVAVVTAYAQAEDPALRKSVQSFYALADRYCSAGQFDKNMQMMTPDYVMVDKQGHQTTLAQLKSMMKSMHSMMKNMKSKTTVKQVQGNMQEAMAWVEMKVSYLAKQGAKWVPMTTTSRYAETLKMTASGWKTKYSQELPTNEPWNFGG